MSVGNRALVYQLNVDTQPPSVKGRLVWTNRPPPQQDPDAAASVPEEFTASLEVQLNFTKPVKALDKVSDALCLVLWLSAFLILFTLPDTARPLVH